MKHLRVAIGLVFILLCALLGSLVPIGRGSGAIIGLIFGIVLSYLFLTYGPGRKKSRPPTSYYLNHQHQVNDGVSQQAIENATLSAREAVQPPLEGTYPRR